MESKFEDVPIYPEVIVYFLRTKTFFHVISL